MTEKDLCNVNAKISSVTLSMADHGCLTFGLVMKGEGWGQMFGGWCLGHGYLGAKTFEGSAFGLECLMRIMDAIGVERWEDLEGKYCRIRRDRGGIIVAIGNIITDHWFDVREFFENADKKDKAVEVDKNDKVE